MKARAALKKMTEAQIDDGTAALWTKIIKPIPKDPRKQTAKDKATLADARKFLGNVEAKLRKPAPKLDGLTDEERDFANRIPVRSTLPLSSPFRNRTVPAGPSSENLHRAWINKLVDHTRRGAVN